MNTNNLVAKPKPIGRLVGVLPGLALCAIATALSLWLTSLFPTVSALLFAILLGVVVRNLIPLPAILESGISFAAKQLLRLGIVILGLQLMLGEILGLGAGMILVVIAIVAVGFASTAFIGRMLGISKSQSLLIAGGFSICGAAAVAAVDGVIETEKEEEVVTAISLVVLFGTLMIPFTPLFGEFMGLTVERQGLWIGGSVHEVAQVVAAGGAVGSAALGSAVIVKLARVLMLAPVMTVLSISRRRSMKNQAASGKRPPIMPLFVFGFIVMVLIRSTGFVPVAVLDVAQIGQTVLLAAAMFALGTGVKFSMFRRIGLKPFILATFATVIVASVALSGVLLVS